MASPKLWQQGKEKLTQAEIDWLIRHGFFKVFPSTATTSAAKANQARREGKRARIEECVFLRSCGVSCEEIAERLGVVRRTVVRYLCGRTT